MTSTLPIVFLFVHGGWHDSATWSKVAPLVQKQVPGAVCTTVDLPSTSEFHAEALEADISAVRDTASKLVDEGKNVVVVMHSYGGLVGTNAVEGLSKEERSLDGQKRDGAVVGMIYISAYVRSVGQSLIEEGMAYKEIGVVDQQAMTITISAEEALEIFYHDLPEGEANYHAKRLKPQALSTSLGKGTYEPWNHGIPCRFVLTEGDRSIPPPYQEKMAARGNMDVFKIKGAGHCVMLSQPEITAKALVELVSVL